MLSVPTNPLLQNHVFVVSVPINLLTAFCAQWHAALVRAVRSCTLKTPVYTGTAEIYIHQRGKHA